MGSDPFHASVLDADFFPQQPDLLLQTIVLGF
jgi:hypothetical protein